MKLLVAGDSFAAEWPGTNGWVKQLAEEHDVTNIAQAGVSEYKILKQVQSQKLEDFDAVIVSHTSPSRVHIKKHPLHKQGLHKDCDLIYTDIAGRSSFFNKELRTAQNYFKHIYDDQYYQDIYLILREKINSIITIPYLSISHLEIAKYYIVEDKHLDFSEFWDNHKGTENHYNDIGNATVLKIILDNLNKIM